MLSVEFIRPQGVNLREYEMGVSIVRGSFKCPTENSSGLGAVHLYSDRDLDHKRRGLL